MDLDHTVLPANSIMPAYLVSVHQMASSLIVVADIYFQLTTHLSTSQIRSAPQIRSYTPTLYSEHLAIWPTTSVLPTEVVLVHGQPQHDAGHTSIRRRHWETEHLPSRDRVSGTAFLLPSVFVLLLLLLLLLLI